MCVVFVSFDGRSDILLLSVLRPSRHFAYGKSTSRTVSRTVSSELVAS